MHERLFRNRPARGMARAGIVAAIVVLLLGSGAVALVAGGPLAGSSHGSSLPAPTAPAASPAPAVAPDGAKPLPGSVTIPVGNGPDAIALDSANGTVFVANEYTNNVTEIAIATDSPGFGIPVGDEPVAIAVDGPNGTAYVANLGSNNVTAVSLGYGGVSANIPVGNAPDAIVFDPLNGYVYVANGGSGTVSVISSVTNEPVATIPVGSDPDAIAIDTQNRQLFVADAGSDNVSVISGTSNVLIATVFVGTSPGVGGSIAYDAVDHDVFVACIGSDNVSVIGGSNHTLLAAVNVGSGPGGLAVDGTRGEVFVANRFSDNVSVIAAANDTVVANVPVGSEPSADGGIAVDPSTNAVYVPNGGSNNLSVLSAISNAIVASVPVLAVPAALSINATSGIVYVADQGAANVSAFALASVSFAAKGLPPGSIWSVAAGTPPLARSNVTFHGGGTIDFLALAGPLPFVITAPSGYGVATVSGPGAPSQTLFLVTSVSAALKVTFGKIETLTFTETGLPTGAPWGVTLTAGPAHGGGPSQSATTVTGSLEFTVVQGGWKFQVTPKPSDYTAAPPHGSVSVGAHPATKAIKFSLLTESVVFREAGLKTGTLWQVNLTGPVNFTLSSKGSSLTIRLPNGTYSYTVANVGGMHPHPTGGNLTIVTPAKLLIVYVTFSDPPQSAGIAAPVAAVAAPVGRPDA